MTDTTDAEFWDQVWDYYCPELGVMTLELDSDDWDFVIGKTYQLLCQKFNCDPEDETGDLNPLVKMMIQDLDWIPHAKNFGVLVQRMKFSEKTNFENMEVIETSGCFAKAEEMLTT